MQRCILAILTLAACAGAQAASESVDINLVTSQSVGQAIGKKPVSMKVPTAPVTSAICRSWWSITTVKQPSRWSRRA